MDMDKDAEIVGQAIHQIWEDWSCQFLSFPCESDGAARQKKGDPNLSMQSRFAETLREALLPQDWTVQKETRCEDLPSKYTAWSKYDIGVKHGSRQIALIELSLRDTSVTHALADGELKLLGCCNGEGVKTHRAYAVERCLSSTDVKLIRAKGPLRNNFYKSAYEESGVLV